MWMMPLHLHVNQKSDYDCDMMMKHYLLDTTLLIEGDMYVSDNLRQVVQEICSRYNF